MRPPRTLVALLPGGLGSPLGRIAVGPVYRSAGNAGVWVLIAGGLSIGSALFIAAATRGSRGEVPAAPGPPANMPGIEA